MADLSDSLLASVKHETAAAVSAQNAFTENSVKELARLVSSLQVATTMSPLCVHALFFFWFANGGQSGWWWVAVHDDNVLARFCLVRCTSTTRCVRGARRVESSNSPTLNTSRLPVALCRSLLPTLLHTGPAPRAAGGDGHAARQA